MKVDVRLCFPFFLLSLVPFSLSFGVPTRVLGGLGGASFVFPLAQGGLHQVRPSASMFSVNLSPSLSLSRSYSFRSAWVGPPIVLFHVGACFLKPVANKYHTGKELRNLEIEGRA